jgi:tryptophan-rich sensory protein
MRACMTMYLVRCAQNEQFRPLFFGLHAQAAATAAAEVQAAPAAQAHAVITS